MKDDLAPITVSHLTAKLKRLVDDGFPLVAVRGEMSNCRPAASGHVFCTLKDSHAQLSALIWRSTVRRLRFNLQEGLDAIAVGRIEVYAPRGEYRLIIEELIPHGIGPLELAFRQTREKLQREGLFDRSRKRGLPAFPATIAVVTSPSGAAVRDLVQITQRRWPACRLIVVPVFVQGDRAAEDIVRGLAQAASIRDVDVIVCGRGGGSIEDLSAFNDELLARAIAASPIPVVSAVGHETDVTIADLAADVRAATPSEAAERILPDRDEQFRILDSVAGRLRSLVTTAVSRAKRRLAHLISHKVLQQPREPLQQQTRRLRGLSTRAATSVDRELKAGRKKTAALARHVDALSPLRTLARGYSVTRHDETGRIVTDASTLQEGDIIRTIFATGRTASRVETIDVE